MFGDKDADRAVERILKDCGSAEREAIASLAILKSDATARAKYVHCLHSCALLVRAGGSAKIFLAGRPKRRHVDLVGPAVSLATAMIDVLADSVNQTLKIPVIEFGADVQAIRRGTVEEQADADSQLYRSCASRRTLR